LPAAQVVVTVNWKPSVHVSTLLPAQPLLPTTHEPMHWPERQTVFAGQATAVKPLPVWHWSAIVLLAQRASPTWQGALGSGTQSPFTHIAPPGQGSGSHARPSAEHTRARLPFTQSLAPAVQTAPPVQSPFTHFWLALQGTATQPDPSAGQARA